MSEATAQFSDLGMEVPVASIGRELKRLWEADEASTNASMMNFAVYSEGPESLVRNSGAIQELTREHACRALLIGMDRDAPETRIKAWITAHCHLAHGKKSVCCEQISFLMEGKALGRLRNTIFSHLASDLPLIFWWQGELSDLFEAALYRMIDRFLFDSAEWADPGAGFARIREAAVARDGIVLQDLAWTRGFHFRLAVAGLFDDLVAQRALGEVNSVRLVANPDQRTTALLLMAWLATQAGWRLGLELDIAAERAEGCDECFTLESREGRSISVKVEWEAQSAPLSLLEISAPDFVVSVSRDGEADFLHQRLESPGHELVLRGPADGITSTDLLAEQLSRGGKNGLFRKVWPVFFDLLRLTGP